MSMTCMSRYLGYTIYFIFVYLFVIYLKKNTGTMSVKYQNPLLDLSAGIGWVIGMRVAGEPQPREEPSAVGAGPGFGGYGCGSASENPRNTRAVHYTQPVHVSSKSHPSQVIW